MNRILKCNKCNSNLYNLYLFLFLIILTNIFLLYFVTNNKTEHFSTYSTKQNKCVEIDNLREKEYLQSKFKPRNCLKDTYTINVDYINNENLSNSSFVQQETLDAINQYPQTNLFIDPLMAGEFKPQCCPSTYTTAHGCLCKQRSTFDLIVTRGGNRASVPIVHY
jgi:hypothetical protein